MTSSDSAASPARIRILAIASHLLDRGRPWLDSLDVEVVAGERQAEGALAEPAPETVDCATIILHHAGISTSSARDAPKETPVPNPRPKSSRKQIVLIAHDNRKADLPEWARFNRETLARHDLHGTGTTGAMVADELGLPVRRFLTGPLGGDQQVGAAIAEGRIDLVIFFWDPLEPQPHDVDVKALLRIAVVHNVPIASNRATADYVLSSPLIDEVY